jgi:excinuclease ABC subunit C
MNSLLDAIPNLGEKRKQELLKHFGSVKSLRKASVEEIAQCPGIGEALAASIHGHLADLPVQTSLNVSTGEISEGA